MPKKLGQLTLYGVDELSEILEIQEVTIRKYLRDGKLKGKKLARRWYVTEESLQDYFRQSEPDRAPEEG